MSITYSHLSEHHVVNPRNVTDVAFEAEMGYLLPNGEWDYKTPCVVVTLVNSRYYLVATENIDRVLGCVFEPHNGFMMFNADEVFISHPDRDVTELEAWLESRATYRRPKDEE